MTGEAVVESNRAAGWLTKRALSTEAAPLVDWVDCRTLVQCWPQTGFEEITMPPTQRGRVLPPNRFATGNVGASSNRRAELRVADYDRPAVAFARRLPATAHSGPYTAVRVVSSSVRLYEKFGCSF